MAEDAHAAPDGRAGDEDAAAQVDAGEFLRLSTALRDAFAAVSAARLDPDESARWHRRLIAITTVAKRDLSRALEQMQRFDADWDKRRR